MPTAVTKTFKSGNSEALRLPREVAYGLGVELTIVRSGDVMTIYPTRPPIAQLIEELNALPRPKSVGVRDAIEPPDRVGLYE
jgi:antitoxin VapB